MPLWSSAAGVFAATSVAQASLAQPLQDGASGGGATSASPPPATAAHDEFPAQDPAWVREMVGVSHGNIDRVKELLAAHPALAKASWDWGFGDHETALGAASHVGNREIAMVLIEHGAAPTLFSAAMLGQLEVVRATCEAHRTLRGIEVQRIAGPHSITLLAHAEAGGEEAKPVYEYLMALGHADDRPVASALSDKDRAKCVGTYTFGETDNDRLTITEVRGSLRLKRGEIGSGHVLNHLGNFEFYPSGANAVRIRFEVHGSNIVRLRVIDGPWMLVAMRA